MKSSNCPIVKQTRNNLSKNSIFNSSSKNSKNNLNNTNKNRARTTKQSPLSLHNNKNNKNFFDSHNSNNTLKLIINLNSKHFDSKEKKIESKEKNKTRVNSQNKKTKQKVNHNKVRGNFFSSPNSTQHSISNNKDDKEIKNHNINQIKSINLKKYSNLNNNFVHTNNESSSLLSSSKNSQLGTKYINNVLKKINLQTYKTTFCTVKHSKKNSLDKKCTLNKNKVSKETLDSNSKAKKTSKIKNIIIHNNNSSNFKSLLSKYSVNSNLTTQTNPNNTNINTQKKLTNHNTNLSKSYAYNKLTLDTNSNKNNSKLISENITEGIDEKSITYKKIINNCYYGNINLNIVYNLFPLTLTNISGKNKIKKTSSKSKESNLTKIRSNSEEKSNTLHSKKSSINNTKGLTNNNTKIINKLNQTNSKKYVQSISTKKNQNINPISLKNSTNSFLTKSESKSKTKISLNKYKSNSKEINLSTSSISSLKDFNYYKNESKKLQEYIKNYGSKTNYKEYPKTTLNFYKIGRRIGHGAFGKVNLALHILSGHIVAIKSFNKSKKKFPKNRIFYEINLMKKLRGHKNIINILETIETETHLCIIMENIPGGNLLNIINKMTKLPENYSKFIFKQLIEAIIYIQSQNIIHRDIKPDNILIDLNNIIKICDFGVGKEVKNNQYIKDSCGTPAFIAPEILSNINYDPFKTDIWSSGVVLYTMLSGVVPFRGNNDYELHKCILNGKFPKLNFISNECEDLLYKLLEVNPDKRIKLNEILEHKWFKDGINGDICLFTNAEKVIYRKLYIDYRKERKEDLVENFTYKNMESDLEDENKNINTTSFIITPYNSVINQNEEIYFEDLRIEDNIMRFIPKVNELNINYEIKNNEDVDQGFIINKKMRKGNNRIMISFNDDFNEEINKNNENNKDNNNNEIEKSPNKIIDDNIEEKKIENKNTNEFISFKKNHLKIEEYVLKYVENFGYKRDYIIKSLEKNELNHATATYFLRFSLQNEIN